MSSRRQFVEVVLASVAFSTVVFVALALQIGSEAALQLIWLFWATLVLTILLLVATVLWYCAIPIAILAIVALLVFIPLRKTHERAGGD